jgi:malate dehydrogenase (oxaloacetate-decarboxylating)
LTYGITNIIFCDSKGIIYTGRTDITKEKQELLDRSIAVPKPGELSEAVQGADIFIGLSKPDVLNPDMVRSMGSKPVIFALANPNPEIMPDVAMQAGAYIVATGRSDFPNQINNSLVFPGAFKGMLAHNIPQFKTEMFSAIAIALADFVQDASPEKIVPTMWDTGVVALVAETIKNF